MMTAYVAITAVFFIFQAGSHAQKLLATKQEIYGWDSLICAAIGAFGLYSLIVEK